MDLNLTLKDLDFLLEALNYSKKNIVDREDENYISKQHRIKEVEMIIEKVRALKKNWI